MLGNLRGFGWVLGLLGALLAMMSCTGSRKLASLEKRVEALEAAAPGVGEKMASVQIHFAKLYFAAEAGNWELAGFELHELEENLEKSARLRPEEEGVNLAGLFDAFRQTQIEAMGRAVAARDLEAFRGSYRESLGVCNACHAATGRPFLVITLPSAPPVTNQLWKALPPEHRD